MNDADVDRAVAAARRAYEKVWAPMSGAERGKYLFRIARGIAERARELAVVETLDNGKPIKETRDFDVPTAAQHFFYHAGWADKLQHLGLGADPRPLGVAGQVIPWNFPLLMAAWKIAPALAAGNTVVIKPAETTPLSILVLAEVIADADLPPGVVNIVPGAGDVGSTLVNHPGLDKVAFTGSTPVGRSIQQSLAGTGRKLTLELGGKGANIVFADAALDQAVEGIVNGIFFNAGQVCCAGSRLLVQESIAEELLAKLRARVETLRVGDPMDKNTDVGAINSARQLERITTLTQAGRDEGAEVWSASCPLPERGWYFPPTLITAASASMRVSREEIFGPVLTVLTFRTPDEALAKANNTPYGLSAGRLDREGLPGDGDGRGSAGRCRLGQHVQPVRPGRVVRRLRRVRLRPGGWTVRDGGLPGHRRRTGAPGVPQRKEGAPMSHLAVPKTYKLYLGGQVPPLRVGPHLPAPRRRRSAAGQRRARLPQGRPGRRGRRPQGVRRLVGRDAVQPGPGDLPDRGDAGRSTGRVRRAADPRRRPSVGGRHRGRRRAWTGWCTTRAGPTSSRPCSAPATRSRGPTSPTPLPSPPGWSRRSPPPAPRCSVWSR